MATLQQKFWLIGQNDEVQVKITGNGTQTSNIVEIYTSAAALLYSLSNAGLLTTLSASVTGTTDASSSTTGTVTTAGGLGVAKKIYAGTDVHAGGVLFGDATTDASSLITGAAIIAGGMAVTKKLFVGTGINLASLTASAAVVTDSSKNLISLGYASTPAASNLAEWDANVNLSANNHISALASTATATATTTLTVASAQQQQFTGSLTQNCVLPASTTLVVGQSFTITNLSSGVVTVKTTGSAATLQAMAANSQLVATCISISADSGTTRWSWNYSADDVAFGTVTSVAMSVPAFLSIAGSPITSSGTLAVTLSGTALPVANGGTGSTSQNFVDLTTAQNIAGIKTFTDATDASNSTTGGLITSGGLAVAKKLYVGTDIHAVGVLFGDSTTDASSSTTGGTILAGGLGVAKKLFVGTTFTTPAQFINSAAGVSSFITYQINSVSKALIGVEGANNNIITGGLTNDLAVSSNVANINFSIDNGGAIHGQCAKTTGAWTLGASSTTPTHRLNTATAATAAGVLTLTNGPTGKTGNPAGYLSLSINGSTQVIPYW